MSLFDKLANDDHVAPTIDWDLIPADTFTIFESWGSRQRIMSKKERSYYFFIDGWQEPPALCLMERGIKHAKVLARIDAPQELIAEAMAQDGKSITLDRNYAINDALKKWLMDNLFENYHEELVSPIYSEESPLVEQVSLPEQGTALPDDYHKIALPSTAHHIQEKEIGILTREFNFYESRHNPDGAFANFLVDNNDGLTVTDKVTGLMWQRGGCDIRAIRRIRSWVQELNENNFAGHNDWRLPTMQEALSLMERETNKGGTHTHPCFSSEQPFIFVANQRRPGGYWFCDYKQAAMFWASGTIPGGFGRVCRSL